MAFYIVLHGSGQQHLDSISEHKPFGDTLSIIADILPISRLWECVGPESIFGFSAAEHTAMAVYKIIEQVIHGETNFTIIAHSRGACQALSIPHIIEEFNRRIKTAHPDNADKKLLPRDVKDLLAPAASLAFGKVSSFLRFLFNTRKLLRELSLEHSELLINNLVKTRINLLLTDPVPGIHTSGFVSWKQTIIFRSIPKSIVTSSLILYAQHDNIWAFNPAVPSVSTDLTEEMGDHEMDILPGVHSSFGGNFFPKNKSLPKTWDYQKVSDTQLITIYRFLEKIVQSDPSVKHHILENLGLLRKTDREYIANKIYEFISANEKLRLDLYLSAYKRLQENIQHYLYLVADTAVLNDITRMILWASNAPRQAFIRVGNGKEADILTRRTLTDVLGTPDVSYVNKHHSKLNASRVVPSFDEVKGEPQFRLRFLDKIEYSKIKQLIKNNLAEINNTLRHLGLDVSLMKIIRVVLHITVMVISKILDLFKIGISTLAPPESTRNKYARLQRMKDKYQYFLDCTEDEFPNAVIKIEKLYTKIKEQEEAQSVFTRSFGCYRKTTTDLGKLCLELRALFPESITKRPSVE